MSYGYRPNVDNQDRHLIMNPFRTKRVHLDKFLINLKAPGIPTSIGKIWATTDSNGHVNEGKDSKLVVVLCRGEPQAGAQDPSTNIIGVSLKTSTTVYLKIIVGPGNEFTLEREIVPHKFPDLKSIPVARIYTIFHEVSHGLGLGDEYGEGYGGKDYSMPDTEQNKENLKLVGNLQPRSELLLIPFDRIISKNIKWKWHRIKTAGILVGNPDQPHPQVFIYEIKLKPGQASEFHKGDRVFLRQRPLIKNPPAITSPELEVHEEPVGDIVKVKALAQVVNINDFSNQSHASILFIPKRATGSTQFELIVHEKILDLIAISGGPLNAPSGDPTRDCETDFRKKVPKPTGNEIQTPNFPSTFHLSKPIAYQDRILGVYEGGQRYHCNIYHPAGSCHMRYKNDATSYCHVCRYILVDIVDPSLHGMIDNLYDDTYSKI